MGVQYKGGYCKKCGENRKVSRKTPNHILHLLLSLVTMGLWLIIWILISVQFGGWRCDKCGSKKVSKVS